MHLPVTGKIEALPGLPEARLNCRTAGRGRRPKHSPYFSKSDHKTQSLYNFVSPCLRGSKGSCKQSRNKNPENQTLLLCPLCRFA